jgi:effector-binding domain-containing protein
MLVGQGEGRPFVLILVTREFHSSRLRPGDVMLSIGDFARHGRVSVRMVRHYDAIGLLQLAYFDQVTGYRSYDAHAGLTPAGPAIAYYEDSPDGDGVIVHATVPVDATPDEDPDFEMIDLPEIVQAATIVHRGSMDNIMQTIQTLARWIDTNGYRSAGYNRELYIECGGNREAWVTELQEPFIMG